MSDLLPDLLSTLKSIRLLQQVIIPDYRYFPEDPRKDASLRLFLLSPREYEVLKLIAEDLPAFQIRSKLCISQSTFHTHVRHIYKKLNIHNRYQAKLFYLLGTQSLDDSA